MLFRAICDHSTQEALLEYFGDDEVPLTASDRLSIIGFHTTVELRSGLSNGVLFGRGKASDLLPAMLGPDDLQIEAPNAMDQP